MIRLSNFLKKEVYQTAVSLLHGRVDRPPSPPPTLFPSFLDLSLLNRVTRYTLILKINHGCSRKGQRGEAAEMVCVVLDLGLLQILLSDLFSHFMFC